MRTIELTNSELFIADMVGELRWTVSRCLRLPHNRGYRPDGGQLEQDRCAAGAECAAARALGLNWRMNFTGSDRATGDIGTGDPVIQVRSTRHRDGGLLLHDNDDPAHLFVFVISDPPTFHVVGWTRLEEARCLPGTTRRLDLRGTPMRVDPAELDSLDDLDVWLAGRRVGLAELLEETV